MTTLLVYHDGERGWIASDGRTRAGETAIVSDRTSKIIPCGKWLVGVTGYGAALGILRAGAGELAKCLSVEALAVAIRQALLASRWQGQRPEQGGPEIFPGWFLVLSGEGAWVILGDGDPEDVSGSVFGAGSGGDFAQGAASAYIEMGLAPAESLEKAIRYACTCDCGSGGTIVVVEAPPPCG